MKWGRIDCEFKTAGAWFRIPKQERCDHHQLEVYCWMQSNGGRIDECDTWKTADWQRAAGTTVAGIRRVVAAGLAEWDGSTLVVAGFDVGGFEHAQAASERQRTRQLIRWAKHRANLDAKLADSSSVPTKTRRGNGVKKSQKNGQNSPRNSADHSGLADTAVSTAADTVENTNRDRDRDRDHPTTTTSREPAAAAAGCASQILDLMRSQFPRWDQAWTTPVVACAGRLCDQAGERAGELPRLLRAQLGRDTRSAAWTKEGGRFVPKPAKWLDAIDPVRLLPKPKAAAEQAGPSEAQIRASWANQESKPS